MKIITVEYRRLRSFGTFENETFGATASVEPDESAEVALSDLVAWVEENLKVRDDFEQLGRDVYEKRRELASVSRDLATACERWEKAKAFLEKYGVDVGEELPF